MKLVVGLGNPGENYQNTRHNVGFMFLDAFAAKKLPEGVVFLEETKFSAHILRFDSILLIKPQTFMNRSGESVLKIKNFYKVELSDLLVIHDDIDLKFGEIKVKKAMGSAGHKGVDDVFSKLGTSDFLRMRVGIGRSLKPNQEVEDFVLESFTKEESQELEKVFIEEAFPLIESFIAQ